MRILRAVIKNFRSIDSLEIDFDPRVTILVGKNDSGKTNLLRALFSFNSRYTYDQEDLPYGSKLRNEYDPTNSSSTDILTVFFRITATDTSPSILTESALRDQAFDVTKLLNNHYRLDSKMLDSKTELPLLVKELGLQKFKEQLSQLKDNLDDLMQKYPGVTKWYEDVYAPSYAGYGFDTVVYSIREKLRGGIPDNLKQDRDITGAVETAVSHLEELGKLITDPYTPSTVGAYTLDNLLPYFVYIGYPGYLHDSTKVEDLDNFPHNKTLRNLLELAKLNLAYLRTPDDMARMSLLGEANAKLEKSLKPILNILGIQRIIIDFMNGEIKIFAQESSGRVSKVNDKSDGFMYLLCLCISFLYESEKTPGAVFLVDDPAMHLHPEWQKNLRAFIEQFSENHQVILTTHSPSLIDVSRLDRVRLVLRDEETGKTIVKEKFHGRHFDSLEPIRSALGIHLTDSLFVGPKTLIVEGPEDYYIVHGMSELCKRLGKNHLDFSEVFILADAGSSVPYFSAIASRIGSNCVVLLDADRGHETKKTIINKWNFKEEAVVLTDAVGSEAHKTTDLLAKESYDRILQNCNNDKVKAAKEIFRICRDEQDAEKLLGNESVNNFSKLFKIINGLFAFQND